MKLIYTGPKPERTVEFPIPFITRAEKEGEVKFVRGKETECPDHWATMLLEMAPTYYHAVESKGQSVMTKG